MAQGVNIGNIYAQLGLDTSKLRTGAKKALGIFSGIKRGVVGLKNAVFSLKGAFATLVIAMTARSFLQVAKDIEVMTLQLQALTGKGKEWFGVLNEWAKTMPLNTKEAIKGFKDLRVYGVEATTKEMTTLVDTIAAVGGGVEVFKRITRAMGQIATRTKLSQQEMLQLSEVGIPAARMIRDAFGLTRDQMNDMGRSLYKMGITTNQIVTALFEQLDAKYKGTAKEMMKTWVGLTERMDSQWFDFKKRVMETGVFEGLKTGLDEFLKSIESIAGQKALEEWANRTAIGVISAFQVIVRAGGLFYKTILSLKAGMASLGEIGAGITEKLTTRTKAENDLARGNAMRNLSRARLNLEYLKREGLVNEADMEHAIWKVNKLEAKLEELKNFSLEASATSDFKNWMKEIKEESIDGIVATDEYIKKLDEWLEKLKNRKPSKPPKEETLIDKDVPFGFSDADKTRTWLTGMEDAWKNYGEEVTDIAEMTKVAMQDAFKGMEEALADFLMTGQFDFKKFVNAIMSDVTRMASHNIVKGLFQAGGNTSSGAGGVFGSIAKIFATNVAGGGAAMGGGRDVAGLLSAAGMASAKGNVFAGAGISAYSNSIVSNPTLFPFAKGIGLMGEAGSEAIMPLARNSSGDLGVKVSGKSPRQLIQNINITTPDGNISKKSISQISTSAFQGASRAMQRGGF